MTQQHYRLTLSEASAHYQKGWITATALLYYYLKIRLAPGWKCTLHQREITEKLGIPKSTFYKAIEKLSEAGLIEWETPNGVVVSLTGLCLTNETESHQRDKIPTNETVSLTNETGSLTNETSTPSKPAQDKAPSDSPDSYQIFSKSLSDSAREKFLNFVREKIKDFPKPINDLEGWLAGKNQAGQYRFRVYYDMFQSEVGEGVAPSADWESHPKWESALAAMRTGVPRFIVLGQPGCDDLDKQTRQAMADYAEANNLIWGEES